MSKRGHSTLKGMGRAVRRRESPVVAPRAITISVLHDDDDVLVINKPAEMEIDRQPTRDSILWRRLHDLGHIDEDAQPMCIPSADRDVSGVVVLARNEAVAERLATELESGRMEMIYLALVAQPVLEEGGTIEALLRIPSQESGRLQVVEDGGLSATTRWRLVDRFVGYSLLECHPIPALRAQVRVHLQAVGMPLAVDPDYGGGRELRLSSFKAGYRRSRRRPERPLIARVSLHVASARLPQPTTGEILWFDAPPPKDFKAALHQLDRFGRV